MKYTKRRNAELQKAVRSYNEIIRRMQKRVEYKDVILPETTSVKEIKSRIQNQNDLRREINSLRRIKDKSAKDIVTNSAGVKYTKYEKKEITIKYRTARRKQSMELKKRQQTPVTVSGEKTGYNRGQMYTNRLEDLEVELKNRSKTARNKSEFRKFTGRLERILSSDYNASRMELFKNNYMKAINYELGAYADEINDIVRKIPSDKLVDLYYRDQDMDIDFVYSPLDQRVRAEYIMERLQELIDEDEE